MYARRAAYALPRALAPRTKVVRGHRSQVVPGEDHFMSLNLSFQDAKDSNTPVHDEWGIILPLEVAVRSSIVTSVSDQCPAASTSEGTDSDVREGRYCTETLSPGARHCPLCLREVDTAVEMRKMTTQT